MTRQWLRAVPVLWIGVWVLPAAGVPAGATTLTWSVVPSPNPGSGNSQSPPETLIETGR